MAMTRDRRNFDLRWWHIPIIFALLPLFLLIALLTITFAILKTISLQFLIWTVWCPRGRDVLFVYSNSPIWHDYIESQILPNLGDRAVVLNWSERRLWRPSIAQAVFRTFGGDQEFNPLAVVFRPFRRTLVFRFYQPFHELKRGKPQSLREVQAELFRVVGVDPNQGRDTDGWDPTLRPHE